MIDFSDVKQWWIGQHEVIKAQLNGTTVWERNTGLFYLTNDDSVPITISITKTSDSSSVQAPTISLEVSDNGIVWTTLGDTSTTPLDIIIPVGGRKYLRSITNSEWGTWNPVYGRNQFSSTGLFGAHGSIMELLGYDTLKGCDCSCMFENCIGLTTTPELPATTLNHRCYMGMFRGCTSLTTAPELPATTLVSECYSTMFYGCTGLTTAPELPAITTANGCYGAMFMGCTSLTTAPELPAEYVRVNAYDNMFYGCSSLNYIKCLAANTYGANWVYGVASSGTFIKNPSKSSWTTGDDGIPSGWTVQDIQ